MYAGRIYADFQNLDDENRIRLNTAGTARDLAAAGVALAEGVALALYTDDADDAGNSNPLLAEGRVASTLDGDFVVAVDWAAVRNASRELTVLRKRFFDTAVADVLRALDGGALIGATTLALCVIDHLGFLRTVRGQSKDFEGIVRSYLKRYDFDWLWATRNSLAHVYGASDRVQKGAVLGTRFVHLRPDLHLAAVNGVRVLNVESFVADVVHAAWAAFDDFHTAVANPLEAFHHLLIIGQSDADADKAYGQMHRWLNHLDHAPFHRDHLEADIRKGLEQTQASRKSA